MYNSDSFNVLLSISTNIPVLFWLRLCSRDTYITSLQKLYWPCLLDALVGGVRWMLSVIVPCSSQVDVLKVDLESAEWKILENLILEQVLDSVGLLLLELHLQWAGFEVGGDEPSVVRYWFSVLRELERAHFRLYHSYSDPSKPRLFLHRTLGNTSSSFTLGWVNTRFTPRAWASQSCVYTSS